MYEEQISTLKRNSEREYNEMITSFAGEHEEMAQMLSESTTEAVEIKNKYIELDAKFQEYYATSSSHIQEQDTALSKLKTELADMHHRH